MSVQTVFCNTFKNHSKILPKKNQCGTLHFFSNVCSSLSPFAFPWNKVLSEFRHCKQLLSEFRKICNCCNFSKINASLQYFLNFCTNVEVLSHFWWVFVCRNSVVDGWLCWCWCWCVLMLLCWCCCVDVAIMLVAIMLVAMLLCEWDYGVMLSWWMDTKLLSCYVFVGDYYIAMLLLCWLLLCWWYYHYVGVIK